MRILRSFLESLLICFAALVFMACAATLAIAACEYAHAFGFLPDFIERVYLSLGGI